MRIYVYIHNINIVIQIIISIIYNCYVIFFILYIYIYILFILYIYIYINYIKSVH